MSIYCSTVLTIVQDHFNESQRDSLIKHLTKPDKEAEPDPMTEVEILRNKFREGILSRKKRKV